MVLITYHINKKLTKKQMGW